MHAATSLVAKLGTTEDWPIGTTCAAARGLLIKEGEFGKRPYAVGITVIFQPAMRPIAVFRPLIALRTAHEARLEGLPIALPSHATAHNRRG